MEIILPLLVGLVAGVASYSLVIKMRENVVLLVENGRRVKIIDRVFIFLLALIFLVYLYLASGKFQSFNVWGFDFVLFDQAIWNTVRGRILENSLKVDAPILLAERFSPILFAFVPLYAVLNDPRLLAVTPAITITLSAVPLYWFARRRVGSALALIVALSFLIAPGVQYLALGQFYEITLTIPLLMLATTFLLERRYVPFFISLALAMICKEEVGFITAAFGVYIFFAHRRPLLGGALALFGMAWVLFLIQVVIPLFQGGAAYYYFGGSVTYGTELYEYLGNSVSEIVWNAITHPDVVLKNVFTDEKIEAVLKILLPLIPLALLGFEVALLALPTFGYTLLSNRRLQYLFGSYHYSPVYVFLFVGLVLGIERFVRWWSARSDRAESKLAARAAVATFILIASITNYYFDSVGPLSRNFSASLYAPSAHDELGEQLASAIPSNAVVLAQSELTSHLAHRHYLFLDAVYPCLSGMDYIFADTRRVWYAYREGHWQGTLGSGWFESIVEKDGYILSRRAAPLKLEKEVNVRFGDALDLIGYTLPLTDTTMGGQGLRLLTAWRAARNIQDHYVLDVDIYDPQGHLWMSSAYEPCQGIRPTTVWTPGEINYDDRVLRLPPTMPSATYRVLVSVRKKDSDAALAARDSFGASLDEVEITSLVVDKNKKSFTASDLWIEERFFVDMGEIRLLGFKPIPLEIKAGEPLPIGLYWRARGKPQGDYLFSVQLRTPNGNVALEHADRPAMGTHPTTQWDAGEVLLDWHDLNLPKTIAPATMQIFVMIRDSQTGRVLGETKLREIEIVE